jgi:hypothetical protein
MKIKKFSYRYAQEILEHPKYKNSFDEILKICEGCPLPVYKDKSSKQKNLDVIQQIINTYFKLIFSHYGWESEPLATPEDNEDSLRSDFRKVFASSTGEKITIQVEVEMGNIASSYRNYFKFQLSYSYDLTNVCLLILPCDKLSRRIDSGVASFEKTVREIPSAKLSITVPTLIIGLDDEGVDEIDLKKYTTDLNILKGSTIGLKREHEKIVAEIIETQINKS